jgi:hypothetical protein
MTSEVSFLAEPFAVPANSSRHFTTRGEARAQPVGTIHLSWAEGNPYLYNAAFDPRLIAHDEAYCTTVRDLTGALQIPTLGHIDRVLEHTSGRGVVDIGCGQGELVRALQQRGIDASGYDPVLRGDGPGLHARYWVPGDEPEASLFVMRCVLPHISQPWDWVRLMGTAHPGALLLVEYQRLEWMADHGIWYQLSHDHVNQFTDADFAARFQVIDQGHFGDAEWAWILIRPDTYQQPEPATCDVHDAVDRLVKARLQMLDALAGREVLLWGAAGKGIILAHALTESGVEVCFAVDADPVRQGKFMEVSGVEVVSPQDAMDALTDRVLVVCNPSHVRAVREFVGASAEILTSHTAG